MAWVPLILLTALSQALKDALIKRLTGRVDVLVTTWVYCLGAGLFLWPLALAEGVPEIAPAFWPALCGAAVLGGVSLICHTAALKYGDLSLSLPMLAFTPVVLLVTSEIMLGESPSPGGLAGVLLIVAGAYALNIGRLRQGGLLAPFRALVQARGPRLMLVTAVLWGVCANFDKIGLRASTPLFWIASAFTACALTLFPLVLARSGGILAQVRSSPLKLAAIGALECVSSVCQMYALTMAIVPYVIALKRLSVVFGALIGFWAFREQNIAERLFGASLMVAGVFFIAILG